MGLSRCCVLALALAGACGGSGGDGQDQSGDGGAGGADADPGGGDGQPGEVDHGFGVEGALETDWRIVAIGSRDGGEVLLATSEYPALVTADGDLAAVDDAWVSGGVARVFPDGGGGWLVLDVDPYVAGASAVTRLTPTLSLDDGFDGSGHFETMGAIDLARGDDGSLFLLGWRSDDRVAVRKLDGDADVVGDYGPDDTGEGLSPEGLELDVPVALAVTGDGDAVVLAADGFIPALVRFTAAGDLDGEFGGGVVVLEGFGPRYGRALAIDEQDRVLVLGMVSDTIQIARVLPDGTLDPDFGAGGMAELTITMPLSSEYDEQVEARAMALQPDGAIVVAATYEYDAGEDGVLEEQSVLVARFLPDGGIDDGFGDGGTVRVSLDAAGSPAQLAYRNGLAITGDRIVVAGQAELAGGEEQGAIRALHR